MEQKGLWESGEWLAVKVDKYRLNFRRHQAILKILDIYILNIIWSKDFQMGCVCVSNDQICILRFL